MLSPCLPPPILSKLFWMLNTSDYYSYALYWLNFCLTPSSPALFPSCTRAKAIHPYSNWTCSLNSSQPGNSVMVVMSHFILTFIVCCASLIHQLFFFRIYPSVLIWCFHFVLYLPQDMFPRILNFLIVHDTDSSFFRFVSHNTSVSVLSDYFQYILPLQFLMWQFSPLFILFTLPLYLSLSFARSLFRLLSHI